LNSYFPCKRKRKKETFQKLLNISMDEILPDFYRTARKMPHMVKRAVFSKSSKILKLLFFHLFFMSPKVKITKKRKTFTAAKFSAGLAEKFCQSWPLQTVKTK
jgi:hypothetical protein